jgi:hypothetical protein
LSSDKLRRRGASVQILGVAIAERHQQCNHEVRFISRICLSVCLGLQRSEATLGLSRSFSPTRPILQIPACLPRTPVFRDAVIAVQLVIRQGADSRCKALMAASNLPGLRSQQQLRAPNPGCLPSGRANRSMNAQLSTADQDWTLQPCQDISLPSFLSLPAMASSLFSRRHHSPYQLNLDRQSCSDPIVHTWAFPTCEEGGKNP